VVPNRIDASISLTTPAAGNAIRSAIIDIQPFSGYLSGEDLKRSEELLQTKPDLLSEAQFKVMKEQIKADVPQMEFAWVRIRVTSFFAE
jgi:hypothetical protein